ncbi:MAG: PhzF family phenazine biosynthesis protein [Alphaproteobacteria bacterium]|nr:PhzF family phenazine biosynthesis protein [Alphaproteobacteria bacterium]
MELKLWQVDAFADKAFEGNPAAVVPLTQWLDDALMQEIAAENNLSETAFFVPSPGKGAGHYDLRWFTPTVEVPLCGHATLASGFVVLTHLHPQLSRVEFSTKSGTLTVEKAADGYFAMALPAYRAEPHPEAEDFLEALEEALSATPLEVFKANYPLAVFASVDEIVEADSDGVLADMLEEFDETGIIITAAGEDTGFDFVSRFFVPGKGIAEDPVTGAAHAALIPFWAKRLGKAKLTARQMSTRGGTLICEEQGERVLIKGKVAPYLEGTIRV